jgi:hypothetical protein
LNRDGTLDLVFSGFGESELLICHGTLDLILGGHMETTGQPHDSFVYIYRNGPEGFDPKRTLRLPTSGPHGMRAIEPGSILDQGLEEFYGSEPFQLPATTRARTIAWTADVSSSTWVRAQIRVAGRRNALPQAAWVGRPDGAWFESGDEIPRVGPESGWIQYRLALGARDGLATPPVREVAIRYG